MKASFFLLIPFCSIIVSCDAQNSKSKKMNATDSTAKAQQALKQSPYELHGILDPGINNMVAFALQTPTGWKMQQNFSRVWNGSTPISQIYIKLASPDQASTIEFLPHSPYYYADGPTTRSLRQTAASYGYPQQANPGEMPPMPPNEYLKRVFLPYLAQNGVRIQVTNEKSFPAKALSNTTQMYTAYIDGEANGKKIRVDCMLNLTTTQMNGEIYYNWEAYPSIIFTNGNLDELYKHVAQARNSFRANPSWMQRNNQLVRNGNIANEDINRRNQDMYRDYQDHIQRSNQAVTDDRNRSADQRNEAFRDVIGGEGKFADPVTGERVKLADKFNHVYKDRNGNYYGTNQAVNEAEFDWVELQRLETRSY
ncbi:MAG: hypothetical protein DI535_24770 [Citrobacter freundii]|nr:MAG: hypothetical protein DI535_24770 [Citrobacter freundii]